MKTAIIITLFVNLVFLTQVTHANWYGNHAISFNSWGSTWLPTYSWWWPNRGTRCDTDGDGVGWGHPTLWHRAVANNNSSSTLNPETDAEFPIAQSGSMRCLYWDASAPQNISVSNISGWTNDSSVTITTTSNDRWWSTLKRILLQESTNNGAWHTARDWNNLSVPNNIALTRTWDRSLVNGNSYRYRTIAYDYANNSTTVSGASEFRFDSILPTGTPVYRNADSSPYLVGSWTNQSVEVGVTCWDSLSGCDMVNRPGWSILGSTYSRTYSSNNIGINWNLQIADIVWNVADIPYWAIRIDKTTPLPPVLTANDRWDDEWSNDRNTNITALKDVVWQVSPRTNYYCLDSSSPYNCIPSSTTRPATNNLPDGVHHFRARTCTEAGNCSTTAIFVLKIDTVVPSLLSDIQNNNPSNMLAIDNYTYNFNVVENGGSPIVRVDYRYEDANSTALSGVIVDTAAPWGQSWDIRRVDNQRWANGGRQYTFRVTRICDEAGNCASGNRNYNHNVFSNTLNITASKISDELSSWILADGQRKDIDINLQDQYGNAIIRASGIGRTIDFNLNINNDLRLDQYGNTWIDSALFITSTSNAIPIWPWVDITQINKFSSTWDYEFPFYIFAPSIDGEPLVPWSANINSISYNINRTVAISAWDNPTNVGVSGTNILIRAQALYTGIFSWDAANQWFIEWQNQSENLVITDRSWLISVTSPSLRSEFWDTVLWVNDENLRYNYFWNGNPIVEWTQASWSSTSEISTSLWNQSFNSLISQELVVDRETLSYLASIIKYSIGWKTVVYPSGIIWKDTYHGASQSNNSYQSWLKVIGVVNSLDNEQVVTDQFQDDIRIIGNLSKASIRKDIEKKAYEVIRYVDPKTVGLTTISSMDIWGAKWSASKFDVWNNTSAGTALYGDTVLYFKAPAGGIVTIQNTGNIEGIKTIIVEDGDVFIDENIRNTDNDGILWIIALNGNILIDTDVTDIHAIIYTNRSILSSSNGTDILDGTTDASVLANQLYIYGSVFSENTIGWSKKTPLQCPFYLESIACSNQHLAQSYDLNYLRRFYVYDSDNDGVADTTSGSRSSSLASPQDYPMIIEYNPQVQVTPPAFFN